SEVLGLDLQLLNGELRFYNPATGKKLLTPLETEWARQAAELAQQEAEQSLQRAIARLMGLGLTISQVAETLNLSIEAVQELIDR
ncbi:MAG: Uma2 family endonuclease, partial [Leptolyngbyaceae cyanobacterium CAN_BIN12]|nr:Uma2 family endonuclease [Leptolyngbyaceae cyanobacterium CAN_BIN12]